jgi:hypothetical protein
MEYEKYAQELASRLHEPDNKIQGDREENERDEGDRHVDESVCQSINEGIVHCGSRLPKNNGPLCKEGRDFGLCCESSKEKCAAWHGAQQRPKTT